MIFNILSKFDWSISKKLSRILLYFGKKYISFFWISDQTIYLWWIYPAYLSANCEPSTPFVISISGEGVSMYPAFEHRIISCKEKSGFWISSSTWRQ